MSRLVLGIGDLAASADRGDSLVTHALGSCVAVVARCRHTGAVGMIHVALPSSANGSPSSLPAYYADLGIPALLRSMAAVGARTREGLQITLVGGASVIDGLDSFGIGKRNVLAARKVLWQHGLAPTAEDVGGEISRSVAVSVGSPEVRITNPIHGTWTLQEGQCRTS
jgi:chemotaxis protein CheD